MVFDICLMMAFALLACMFLTARETVRPLTQDRIHYYVRKVGTLGGIFYLERIQVFCEARDTIVVYAQKQHVMGDAFSSYTKRDMTVVLALTIVCAGIACCIIVQNPVFFFLGCLVAFFGVIALGRMLKQKEKEQIAKEVPQVFRLLSGALTSGQTLTQAIEYVGRRGTGEIAVAFAQGALEIQCGGNAAHVLDSVAARIDAPSLKLLSCVLQISQRTGAPLADLLERGAQLVEDQSNLKQLLSTKTAQVRFSAQVVMVLPALLVGLLALLSPDFRAGVMSPLGFGAICVAVVLDSIAFLSMKKIMACVDV